MITPTFQAAVPTAAMPLAFSAAPQSADFTGHGTPADLGQNWQVAFRDADGTPLNMQSFEQIDFGAISFKEIFQNVKTIVATPLFSAALERLLGVDARIVDLPINAAAEATVALLQAVYTWEPRAQTVEINFAADVINGHLIAQLQLNIINVIAGTDTPYSSNNIDTRTVFGTYVPPLETWQDVQPHMLVVEQPVLVPVRGQPGTPGTPGTAGARGSLWFTGSGPPTITTGVQPQDMYLDGLTGDVHQFDGVAGTWRKR
jgi:phage baseplate assembly protein W